MNKQNNIIDVAVIGGGPAGMQAALVLARTGKKIVVFDTMRVPAAVPSEKCSSTPLVPSLAAK